MLFHREKNECEDCGQRFGSQDDLIYHVKNDHHKHVPKCTYCGKEFLHEKDRLHHVREENEKKVDARRHK